MLQVRDELCIGCGLCERVCPQGAIHLIWGKAHIDQDKCIRCHRCEEVCPRGAIREEVEAVSLDEVKAIFQNLENKVKETINKLEKLERRE